MDSPRGQIARRVHVRETAARALFLFVIPTACALYPWVHEAIFSGPFGWTTFAVLAVVPLAGLSGVLVYRSNALFSVPIKPYLPFATVATVFCLTVILSKAQNQDGEMTVAFLIALLCGVAQPFLAVIGGLSSFMNTSKRTRTSRPD